MYLNETEDYWNKVITEPESWLKRIGNIPMLEENECIILGNKVQEFMEIENFKLKFFILNKREPSIKEISKDLDLSIFQIDSRIKDGKEAREIMIDSNMKFVISIAKKYQTQGLDLYDLVKAGHQGLCRVIECYNPKWMQYEFFEFAYSSIKQNIEEKIANRI